MWHSDHAFFLDEARRKAEKHIQVSTNLLITFTKRTNSLWICWYENRHTRADIQEVIIQ